MGSKKKSRTKKDKKRERKRNVKKSASDSETRDGSLKKQTPQKKTKEIRAKYSKDDNVVLDLNKEVVNNMKYKDAAPSIISLFGPSVSLTSDLLQSIIKILYKKSRHVEGPVTLRTSRTRRATFIKVENNIMEMIDAAKISDLVVLVVDGNKGIEKEHVEFITLLNAFGMPKMLVYVAMDGKSDISSNKIMKSIKKMVWKEITPGIKVFANIKMLINSIAVFKSRPLSFKCSNSYVIADFIMKEGNGMRLRGYVRGKKLFKNANFYVPGVGNVEVGEMLRISDPCEIQNEEKVLERRKVFMHAPRTFVDEEVVEHEVEKQSESEEFVLYEGEKFEYDEMSDDSVVNDVKDVDREESMEKSENVNDEVCKDDKVQVLSFEMLRESALQKLKENYEIKDETSNEETVVHDSNEKDKDPISSANIFMPGDYVEIFVEGIFNYKTNGIVILSSINYTNNTINTASFTNTKYFPHFIKSDDPIFVSVGWQRFISFPTFFKRANDMNVYLKSSSDNCYFGYFGQMECKGSNVVLVRQVNEKETVNRDNNFFYNFRVVGTGKVQAIKILSLSTDSSREQREISGDHFIHKKLKLVGTPCLVKGNMSFVRGMFNSNLEVNKFLYANIKTTNGVRGIIKKAVGKNGNFRASFEGEITKNDVVILNTFVKVGVNELVYVVDEKIKEVERLRLRREVVGRQEDHEEVSSRLKQCDLESDKKVGDHISRCHEDGKYRNRKDTLLTDQNSEIKIPSHIISKLPLDKRLCYAEVSEDDIGCVLSPFEREEIRLRDEIKMKRQLMEKKALEEKNEQEKKLREMEKEKQRIKREGIIKRKIKYKR